MSSNARSRSSYYENANREFCKIVDYGKDSFDFSFIKDQCRRWIVAYVHEGYVVLKHKTENKWLLIRQFNRFQPAYKIRLKENLRWLRFVGFDRSRHGKRQTIETLINEGALLFAQYLRDEQEAWSPRIAI